MQICRPTVDNPEDYIKVTYFLRSKTHLLDAAFNLAIGQSVGNPLVRVEGETEELFEQHSCIILDDPNELQKFESGTVTILFPVKNFNLKEDGLNQLLVQLMGGQMDIDNITTCHLLTIEDHPMLTEALAGPKFGLTGIREHCGLAEDQVVLGGIVKPKIGLSPEQHLEIVKHFIDGGCNFIKEDEILGDQSWNPMTKRVELVTNYLAKSNNKAFYCVAISSDPANLLKKAKTVAELGGNGIHVNFHCGMGAYKSLRELDLPLLMHFQKSGDKVLSFDNHRYHISDSVLFKLAGMAGCDTLHVGMLGGYMSNDPLKILQIINMLNKLNCVPALSCGMQPGIVDSIKKLIGHGNWMANVGAALTGHPGGTEAGVRAMQQAISGQHGDEYFQAVALWGEHA